MSESSIVLLLRNMDDVKMAAKAFKKNSVKDKSLLKHLQRNPEHGINFGRGVKIEDITWYEYSVKYTMSNGDVYVIMPKLGVHIYDSRGIIPMTELVVMAWSELRTTLKQQERVLKERHPIIFGEGLVVDMAAAIQPDGFNVVHDNYVQTEKTQSLQEKIASVIYKELCKMSIEELKSLEWTATNRFREGYAANVSTNGAGMDDDNDSND